MEKFLATYEALSLLQKIYTTSLVIGILIPLLDLFVGFFSASLDFSTDIDGDINLSFTWLPLSPLAILSFLILFGGGGLISLFFVGKTTSLIIAIIAGYLFAVTINKFIILPLKKNQPLASSVTDIIGQQAKVTSSIIKNSYGEIVITIDSITLNYSAVSDNNELIRYGEIVKVLEIRANGIAVVQKEFKEGN